MRTLFIALLTICSTTTSAATLTETLALLAKPTMAGNAESVDGFTLTVGHTTFTLTGEVEGVLGAEQEVGFAFKGTGKIAIAIEEGPFEQANLTTIRDDVGAKAASGGVFHRQFEGGVFFTNNVPETLFAGEHVTSSRLADIVDRSVERWNQTR